MRPALSCHPSSFSRHVIVLIHEAARGAVAVEQLFEKAFVGELGGVEGGANFLKDGRRNSPSHPCAHVVGQVPTSAQETFDHLDLSLVQSAQVCVEWDGL